MNLSRAGCLKCMISVKPGLNSNLMFWFMHFCRTVRFKTLNHKVLVTQKYFVEKHVQIHDQKTEKFRLNILVNQGLI